MLRQACCMYREMVFPFTGRDSTRPPPLFPSRCSGVCPQGTMVDSSNELFYNKFICSSMNPTMRILWLLFWSLTSTLIVSGLVLGDRSWAIALGLNHNRECSHFLLYNDYFKFIDPLFSPKLFRRRLPDGDTCVQPYSRGSVMQSILRDIVRLSFLARVRAVR